jgi:hypothetical protein
VYRHAGGIERKAQLAVERGGGRHRNYVATLPQIEKFKTALPKYRDNYYRSVLGGYRATRT